MPPKYADDDVTLTGEVPEPSTDPALVHHLADAVETAVGWAREADQLVAGDLTALDVAGAAYLVDYCKTARTHLAAVEQALANRIVAIDQAHRDRLPMTVPGLGVVEVRRSADRKAWEHDQLGAEVVRRHLAAAGGELPDPFDVARQVLAAAAPSYWRTGVLKALGIDPGDYCTTTPGRRTVQITTPTKGPGQ